jgi:hypothetical protein
MSDTLASLQAAIAPKSGLHPVPLASESYELVSTGSSEHLVNFFAERLPPGGRSPFILKPTPGLTLFDTLGTGPILALTALATPVAGSRFRTGQYWAISGTHAFVRREDLSSAVDLGSVGTVTSGSGGGVAGLQPADYNAVSIAVGLNEVLFCVPPEVFVLDKISFGMTQLVGGVNNYPGDASSVAYLDGYYIFLNFNGEQMFVSNLLDALNYTALAFAQISSYGDYGDCLFVHNSQLWVFGQNAAQPWYDTGDPTFPFAPVAGSMVMHGLGAQRSIVEIDNSMIFLGNDGCVYQIRGYNSTKISTPAVEEQLSNYNGGYLRGITACAFSYEGHAFYSMSLPVTGFTFVYDCATSQWHTRSTAGSVWMVSTAARLDARVICGDRSNGNLYHLDSSNPLENGVAMTRQATLPALVGHGPREFMNRLEIEMSVGVDGGSISVDWSDDGGVTYRTPARVLSTGAPGATKTRVATTRLGSFYTRNLRLTTTAGKPTIYSVDCDIPPRAP